MALNVIVGACFVAVLGAAAIAYCVKHMCEYDIVADDVD